MDNKLELKQYYVLYIDILGAKNMIKSDKSEEFLQKIDSLYKNTLKVLDNTYKDRKFEIKTKIFSDNIIIAVPKDTLEYSSDEANKVGVIFHIATFFQILALQFSILTRGSIIIDDLYIDNTFVYGNALVKAYELESEIANYPRIVINHKDVLMFKKYQNLNGSLRYDHGNVCYINPFQSYFEISKCYKQAEIRDLSIVLYKKFNEIENCKIAQKVFWLINEFNEFCINNNIEDCAIDCSRYSANIKGYQY